jgi:hypothetical protein
MSIELAGIKANRSTFSSEHIRGSILTIFRVINQD